MLDRILEFYFYFVVLSFLSSVLVSNLFLSNLGLRSNPKGYFFNPIKAIEEYLVLNELKSTQRTRLLLLKNWYLANLVLLFAGTPVMVIMQVMISSS